MRALTTTALGEKDATLASVPRLVLSDRRQDEDKDSKKKPSGRERTTSIGCCKYSQQTLTPSRRRFQELESISGSKLARAELACIVQSVPARIRADASIQLPPPSIHRDPPEGQVCFVTQSLSVRDEPPRQVRG